MSSLPTTLGQYQIIREIARSNDIVYEAYDPLMNRRVAIKELAVPPGSTPQQREERVNRFKREAQAAGTLNHPNIMTVFSFAEDAGRIFMALEYLDGNTLRNEIDTKGFIPSKRAIEVATEVLEGLGHAHSKGVIHRDIKPDNIQILSNGAIKITDFGIARLTFQPNLTMDGQVFGTPSYMSPEQVVGKEIDARSDLFSVGVVLYEMIAGQKPFTGDSVVSITYAIMNTDPPKPQQCGAALWEVIRRALDKSPMMRFASAAEMATALREAERLDSTGGTTSTLFGLQNAQPIVAPPYQHQPQQPIYTYNPYTGQSTGSIAPVPAPQPVNPYGPGPYQQPYSQQYPQQPQGYGYQQPYAGGTMPPPSFPPVFYPPPPRTPLLKPETADFLRKLFIALIVMGTLFALFFVAIGSMMKALQDYDSERQDRDMAASLQLDERIPIDERIQTLKERRSQLRSAKFIEQADRAIAVLLAEQGQAALQKGNISNAEALFQESVERDPRNPTLYTNLASLYERRALQEGDPNARVNLLKLAGDHWRSAYELELRREVRQEYGNGAAAAYVRLAQELSRFGGLEAKRLMRTALFDAREIATPGSVVHQEATNLLDQVGP